MNGLPSSTFSPSTSSSSRWWWISALVLFLRMDWTVLPAPCNLLLINFHHQFYSLSSSLNWDCHHHPHQLSSSFNRDCHHHHCGYSDLLRIWLSDSSYDILPKKWNSQLGGGNLYILYWKSYIQYSTLTFPGKIWLYRGNEQQMKLNLFFNIPKE